MPCERSSQSRSPDVSRETSILDILVIIEMSATIATANISGTNLAIIIQLK